LTLQVSDGFGFEEVELLPEEDELEDDEDEPWLLLLLEEDDDDDDEEVDPFPEVLEPEEEPLLDEEP